MSTSIFIRLYRSILSFKLRRSVFVFKPAVVGMLLIFFQFVIPITTVAYFLRVDPEINIFDRTFAVPIFRDSEIAGETSRSQEGNCWFPCSNDPKFAVFH